MHDYYKEYETKLKYSIYKEMLTTSSLSSKNFVRSLLLMCMCGIVTFSLLNDTLVEKITTITITSIIIIIGDIYDCGIFLVLVSKTL